MKFLRHFVANRQLDAFADGELHETQVRAVILHLDECASCEAVLRVVYFTKTALTRLAYERSLGPNSADAAAVKRLERWAQAAVGPDF